ncbi:hypothetical protein KSF_023380 [Reticulibacter mediterranei]|uniref:DUF1211 domain-containing protein n=1 Tax=Reticulibacter mediterranei TaxID=2778369 RepID=A0A8J3N1K3_9CHLR|nr:TMEM175 family protein [Reticulibacter mediterranei]GHO92290.1 hypothetical protein KSF_023380 [Reticulibacter mediterranei]
MEVSEKPREVPMKKGLEKLDERLNMLCDGVFAIAMTLLVLDIKLDLQGSDINAALGAFSDKIIIYIISFFVIAGYWNEHRQLMKMVRRMNAPFIRFTFIFLAFVTFFPIAFSMVMDAGHYAQVISIYTLVMAGCGLSISLLWWYACGQHRLIDTDRDEAAINERILFGLITPAVACAALLFIPLFPDHPQRIFYFLLLSPVIRRIVHTLYESRQKQLADVE